MEVPEAIRRARFYGLLVGLLIACLLFLGAIAGGDTRPVPEGRVSSPELELVAKKKKCRTKKCRRRASRRRAPARPRVDPSPEQWARLRQCESGGNYANKRNPRYRGAYQASWSTWNNYGGYHDPADAPPAVQDQFARDLYARRGRQPWPVCGRYLP